MREMASRSENSPWSVSKEYCLVDQFKFFGPDSEHKNILFLDIDGVLNSQRWYRSREYSDLNASMDKLSSRQYRKTRDIDTRPVMVLNKLVEMYSLSIVITSSWRIGNSADDIAFMMAARGFKYPKSIIGKTPSISTNDYTSKVSKSDTHRGLEIESWMMGVLVRQNRPSSIVIIDDDSDFGRLRPFHLKTSAMSGGLTERLIPRVGLLLERQRKYGTELWKQRSVVNATINPRWKPDAVIDIAVTWKINGFWDLAKLIAPYFDRYDRAQTRRGTDHGYKAASRHLSALVIRNHQSSK